MALILMLGLLLGTYFILTLVHRLWWRVSISPSLRGRCGLALMFLFTGVGHFAKTEPMVEMLPSWVPLREAIIYGTGVLEFAAAAGLMSPSLHLVTGRFLILFLVLVFPANVYAAFQGGEMGGGDLGLAYLLIRAPVQLLLIGWTYWFAVRRN